MIRATDAHLADAWDAAVRQTPVEERVAMVGWLRELGQQRVWAQADRAGIEEPYERAVFALDRLYPRLPEPHREAFLSQLRLRMRSDADRP